MTDQERIEPCPFCGADGSAAENEEFETCREHEAPYVVVICDKCGARAASVWTKHFRDFSEYDVDDFRRNPSLRAAEDDRYDNYIVIQKNLAIESWNRRVTNAK